MYNLAAKGMSLVIKQRNVSDIVVLNLTGRLWILDLPLRDLMSGLLSSGNRHFVLNLEGLDYIDSSGLGQLISIWKSVRNKGGYMTLLNPNKRVRQLFAITRLNTVFEICREETDAVEKARKALA